MTIVVYIKSCKEICRVLSKYIKIIATIILIKRRLQCSSGIIRGQEYVKLTEKKKI